MEEKPPLHICLVGFGNANRAFAQILVEKKSSLPFRPIVIAIFTGKSGRVVRRAGEAGVNLVDALTVSKIADLAGAEPGGLSVQDTIEILRRLRKESVLDILVEGIPTDHTTGEPALGITKAALQAGVSVVSANKAPVAIALDSLLHLADANHCRYLHESACMDGIPIFNLARHCLPHARIRSFEGILNSTTNVILDQLEKDAGLSFGDALRVAQDMGIAETDPSADVDGWDAAVKCVCLSRVLGICTSATTLQDVKPVEGIREMTGAAVASHLPQRFKLVCRGTRGEDGSVRLSVCKELVPPTSSLHSVAGASSCVTFYTDVLGPMTIVQTNPTIRDTGYGLFADVCEAWKSVSNANQCRPVDERSRKHPRLM